MLKAGPGSPRWGWACRKGGGLPEERRRGAAQEGGQGDQKERLTAHFELAPALKTGGALHGAAADAESRVAAAQRTATLSQAETTEAAADARGGARAGQGGRGAGRRRARRERAHRRRRSKAARVEQARSRRRARAAARSRLERQRLAESPRALHGHIEADTPADATVARAPRRSTRVADARAVSARV